MGCDAFRPHPNPVSTRVRFLSGRCAHTGGCRRHRDHMLGSLAGRLYHPSRRSGLAESVLWRGDPCGEASTPTHGELISTHGTPTPSGQVRLPLCGPAAHQAQHQRLHRARAQRDDSCAKVGRLRRHHHPHAHSQPCGGVTRRRRGHAMQRRRLPGPFNRPPSCRKRGTIFLPAKMKQTGFASVPPSHTALCHANASACAPSPSAQVLKSPVVPPVSNPASPDKAA